MKAKYEGMGVVNGEPPTPYIMKLKEYLRGENRRFADRWSFRQSKKWEWNR